MDIAGEGQALREFILIALIVFILSVSIFSFFKLKIEIGSQESKVDHQPLNNVLIIWVALVIAAVVLLFFVMLNGKKLNIENNIGQIGDFVGGLINPVLSFLALLVLLRTTMIQTNEARKTTNFMALQQKILEAEKFETTFFHLVDRVEKYCETFLRIQSEDTKAKRSMVSEVVRKILEKRSEFDAMSTRDQLKSSRLHVSELVENDDLNIFIHRVVRVITTIAGSSISEDEKRYYINLFIDTLLPEERIVFTSYIFFRSKPVRKLVKDFGFCYLKNHAFPCRVIAEFYGKSDS